MPSAIVIWIWFCAYLNCAGWTLSALHLLNEKGYAAAFALGLALVWIWKIKTGAQIFPKFHPPKFRRRFKRIFPLSFLILAVLAFFGGALHAPGNFDTLAYRTPRVLHWLAAGQWEWIHSEFPRLNTRTAGWEWLTAPQLLFLHSDRFLFLLNIVSFLLLPGRIFALLTRLGVRPRAAWHWMWIFPGGYGYVLQAGSAVNDLFGALLTFAAFEFALRAREEKKFSHVSTAILATALMTAVKAFNLVLLPTLGLLLLPALKTFLRRPLAALAVAVFALSISMLPTSLLNAKYCGDWQGAKLEQTPIGGGHEVLRLAANVPNILLGNFTPPIFPFTSAWEKLVQSHLPPALKQNLDANMEGGLAKFQVFELQVEEVAGLGFGVSLLMLVLLLKKIRAGELFPAKFFSVETLVPLGVWAGVGIFLIRAGIAGPARYLLPFYVLLLAPLLAGPVAGQFFRARLWRLAALAASAFAALLLVISPTRPLWPADFVLEKLDAEHSQNSLLKRIWTVNRVYGGRADSFAPVIEKLPNAANPLGLIEFDEPEAALWKPFGSRRIVHLRRDDSAADIRKKQIQYALVSADYMEQPGAGSLDRWRARCDAEVVENFELKIRAGRPPEKWQLVRFR